MARILITSTQYPYYGGAATNSYALIKYLRSFGHMVAGVFFESSRVNVDPDKIGGVWKFDPGKDKKSILNRLITRQLGGLPDVIFGKNYAAPVISKELFPNVKIVYLVTGSPQMSSASENGISAQKYLSGFNIIRFKQEEACIRASDLVVPNSWLGKKLLIKNYGENKKFSNPIDTSLAFNNDICLGENFTDRKWDLAFICSNLSRKVKNSELAINIMSEKKFDMNKKIVVGKNSSIFNGIKNMECRDLSSQREVLEIMKNTKVILCTSYYDASPNTIKEAILCGSNILMSRNCGWYESYPSEFICDDVYDKKEWINKISYLLKNKVAFNVLNKNSLIEKMKEII
jgi:glycosyltransferase involved in cell wall biosynthesis